MAGENELYRIDSIRVDGEEIAIEDGTGTIEGAAGFESDAVLSASGPDFTNRKRVPRMIKCKVQFAGATTPEQFSKMSNVQIVASNLQSGRRVRANKCTFARMGAVGSGSVDLEFNVLTPFQWL